MADVTISDLTENVAPPSSAFLAIDNASVSEKVTIDNAVGAATGVTPLAHNTTHQTGGADAIKLDDLAAPDDNTDLDATTSLHGLLPKSDKLKLDNITNVGGGVIPESWEINILKTRTKWGFISGITESDPGIGSFKLNHATPSSATAMYINQTDGLARDMEALVTDMHTNARLILSDDSDVTKWNVFKVTGTITDNSGWYTLPIVHEAGGTDIVTSTDCLFDIHKQPMAKADSDQITTNQTDISTANSNISAIGPSTQTLTDAATIAWAVGSSLETAIVTLAGNRTLGAPTGTTAGDRYFLIVKQDGVGSRTLAYNAVFKFPGGVAPVLSTAINAVDILSFVVEDASNIHGVITKNFS